MKRGGNYNLSRNGRKTGKKYVIKQWEGVSPALFLRNLRLKEAASMMQYKRLSIKEVAAECGFMDCSHFCHLFIESYGIAPETFRKSGMY
jgi:transcriptional regulator GlxA family with amidase domain